MANIDSFQVLSSTFYHLRRPRAETLNTLSGHRECCAKWDQTVNGQLSTVNYMAFNHEGHKEKTFLVNCQLLAFN